MNTWTCEHLKVFSIHIQEQAMYIYKHAYTKYTIEN